MDHLIHDALSSPEATPDLTANIMSRLGYEQVDHRARRRRRLLVWANRAGLLGCATIAVVVAMHVYQRSPDARVVAPITVPDAVRHDMNQHSESINRVIDRFRNFTPRTLPTPPPVPAPQPQPERAFGPFQWV